MTFDNANKKSIREAEKNAKLHDSNRIAYTRTIMSTIFGREWMHDLLLRCNVFHTPFSPTNSQITAFNCGTQNIGLQLFGDIATHCPHEYSLMMTEASIKDEANGRRTEPTDDTIGSASSTSPRRNAPEPSSGYGIDQDGFVTDTGYVEDRAEGGTEDGAEVRH